MSRYLKIYYELAVSLSISTTVYSGRSRRVSVVYRKPLLKPEETLQDKTSHTITGLVASYSVRISRLQMLDLLPPALDKDTKAQML